MLRLFFIYFLCRTQVTYILLIAIAIEFSQTLHNIANPAQILSSAIGLALSGI